MSIIGISAHRCVAITVLQKFNIHADREYPDAPFVNIDNNLLIFLCLSKYAGGYVINNTCRICGVTMGNNANVFTSICWDIHLCFTCRLRQRKLISARKQFVNYTVLEHSPMLLKIDFKFDLSRIDYFGNIGGHARGNSAALLHYILFDALPRELIQSIFQYWLLSEFDKYIVKR